MRRTNQTDPETRRSVVILGVSGLAIVATTAALFVLRRSPRQAQTACVAGAVTRKTVVLVDHTDPWSPSTAALLTAHLRRIADRTPTEERLVMLAFDGSSDSLRPDWNAGGVVSIAVGAAVRPVAVAMNV